MPDDSGKDQKGAGHRKRLRAKFLHSGLAGFHDYEVIELLLTLTTPRKDCKTPAKSALKKFKTLQGVLEAPVNALCEVDGIGPNNVIGIKLIKSVADRFLEKKLIQKDPLSNSEELFNYLYHRFASKDREIFIALFLDAKNRVISTKTLFEGTLTASSVYPREVIKEALEQKAAALIFAHNHPSGDPKPSAADHMVTKKLVFAALTMGITVHEHLVIGNGCYFSFADHGFIKEINLAFQRNTDQEMQH